MCLKTLKIPVSSFCHFCTFSAPALYISIAAKVAYFAPWFPFWKLCPQNSFFMACIIDVSFFYVSVLSVNAFYSVRKFRFFIVRSLFAARPPALWVLFVCCLCVVSSEQVLFYLGKMIAGNSPVFIPLNVVLFSCLTFVPPFVPFL